MTAATCRFCADVAVARFALDEGCLCFPQDREQALCVQHVIRASPRGSMDLIEVLIPELWAWATANGVWR